jgi:hypothetical protein
MIVFIVCDYHVGNDVYADVHVYVVDDNVHVRSKHKRKEATHGCHSLGVCGRGDPKEKEDQGRNQSHIQAKSRRALLVPDWEQATEGVFPMT